MSTRLPFCNLRSRTAALFAAAALALAFGCSSGSGSPVPTPPPPAAPTITGIAPASGPVGTAVTVTGTNLDTVTAVAFSGTAATLGAHSATQLATTVPSGATSGTLSVTGPGGQATSSASFTVVPPLNVTVTTNPTSLSVSAGATASFSAAATGTPTPTVKWQQSTDGGATFADVTGATSTPLSFTASLGQSGYQYRAVFTNSTGSATSSAATLTVTPVSNVVVTANPTNLSVLAGATASFSAAATGTPTPTVQWQQSTDGGATFTNVTGATSTPLSFTATSGQSGYQYHAVFTNSTGSATSTAATLTIQAGSQPWQAASALDTNPGVATFPQEAIDATGNILVVWSQNSANTFTLWANRYDATAGTWGTAQQISALPALVQVPEYTLSMGPNGDGMVVWIQALPLSGGGVNKIRRIYVATYDHTTHAWSAPVFVGGEQPVPLGPYYLVPAYPQVAMDASGNALVVWEQGNGLDPYKTYLWAARYTPGSGWVLGTAPLTADANVSSLDQRMAMDGAGNAMVTYTVYSAVAGVSDVRLKATRYSASTATWSPGEFIAADQGGLNNVTAPQVSAMPGGDAMAAWTQNDGTVLANHYSASSGSWGTEQVLGPAGSTNDVQVAMDASGNAWAVWTATNSVWVDRYTAGSGWGTAVALNPSSLPYNAYASRYPKVAINGGGNAVVVWTESVQLTQTGSPWPLVKASFCPAGGTWTTPQLLESVGNSSAHPQVVLDTAGKATAVWQKNDPSGLITTIWAARSQ